MPRVSMGWDVLPTRNAEAVMLLGNIVRGTVIREIAKGVWEVFSGGERCDKARKRWKCWKCWLTRAEEYTNDDTSPARPWPIFKWRFM